jgi:transposase
MPAASKIARHWRTRKDPLDGIWEEKILPLLEADEKGVLQATSIVAELEYRHPELSLQSQVRTLQRRMRDWRATQGPPREVFFPQEHLPGVEGAFDFTNGNELEVTIAGEDFPHLIFEFVLSSSKHTRTSIAYSETYEALSSGLQRAFWEIGGVPKEVRSDNLSAATHELKKAKGRTLTMRYRGLLEHYRATSTLIRPGKANENGVVEQRHRWTKKLVAEALVFRGSKDFQSAEIYAAFVQDAVDRRHNAKHQDAFQAEQMLLTPLPASKLPDCTEYTIKVTRWSTLRVLGRIYSVPSRLIGHQAMAKLYADHLEVFYAGVIVERCPRIRQEDGHRIDYRHVVHSLMRKPGAFAKYRFREDLFPSLRFRRGYDAMVAKFGSRADVEYVRVLHLAATTMECKVDQALQLLLETGQPFGFTEVESLVAPKDVDVPIVHIASPSLEAYDELLSGAA